MLVGRKGILFLPIGRVISNNGMMRQNRKTKQINKNLNDTGTFRWKVQRSLTIFKLRLNEEGSFVEM